MQKTEIVVKLLEENWDYECDEVGPTNVEDIATGDTTIEKVEGASNLDLQIALTILAMGAGFIRHCLEIQKILEEKFKKKPTDKDIELEMEKDPITNKDWIQIDKSVKVKIYKRITEIL